MAQFIRTYYDKDNTKLNEEYYEVDGKKQGQYKSYDRDGRLEEICNYIDDIIHGESISYYCGNLFSICYYRNGKRNGIQKSYYGNDKIKKICYFIDEVLNGDYIEYYQNGNIRLECKYINYKMEGEYKEYYSNGILKNVCNYINGLKYGKDIYYYESGTLNCSYTYTNGILNGFYQKYNDENENIEYICNYVNDKIIGQCNIYDLNGNLIEQKNY